MAGKKIVRKGAKYKKSLGACRIWTRARTAAGYGVQSVSGKLRYAHRLAYEACYGPIPEGMVLDHLCRNPSCYRASHLEAVTTRENVRRGKTWKKLTPETAEKIRSEWGGRYRHPNCRELAEKYGTTTTNINYIVRGVTHNGR